MKSMIPIVLAWSFRSHCLTVGINFEVTVKNYPDCPSMSDMSDYRQSLRIIISPESKSTHWPNFTFCFLPDPQILRKWDAGFIQIKNIWKVVIIFLNNTLIV